MSSWIETGTCLGEDPDTTSCLSVEKRRKMKEAEEQIHRGSFSLRERERCSEREGAAARCRGGHSKGEQERKR